MENENVEQQSSQVNSEPTENIGGVESSASEDSATSPESGDNAAEGSPPTSPTSDPSSVKIRRRRNSESIFPPLRLTVENQFKALTYYADLSEGKTRPVSASDVAARIQRSSQTVAGYTKFFTSLNLINPVDKTSTFLPSDALYNYANLRETDQDRANEQLRPLIKTSWFGQAIVSEIKVNGTRSFNQILSALALVAKVKPEEKEYGAQLQQLIEWAEVAKLIRNQDGIYSLVPFNGEADVPKSESPDEHKSHHNPPPSPPPVREPNKKGGKDAILEAVENTFRLGAIIELEDDEQNELLMAIKVVKKYAAHPAFNDGAVK